MVKKILSAVLLAFACVATASATTVVVTGTNVLATQSGQTAQPLTSGLWCFGATCGTVTNGSFTDSVSSGTATVTVTVGSATILSIPNVTLSGTAYNWNSFVVPATALISGMGYPTISCLPGAIYSQTDAIPSPTPWLCRSQANVNIWLPAPYAVSKAGSYTGAGIPTFLCYGPCQYIQNNAAFPGQSIWALVATQGTPSNNWVLQGASIAGGAVPGITGCGTTATQTGGSLAGTFVAAATSCAAVVTPGFTAPNGFSCGALDLTTTSDTIKQTATSTTTFTLTGTVASSDVISFHCTAY